MVQRRLQLVVHVAVVELLVEVAKDAILLHDGRHDLPGGPRGLFKETLSELVKRALVDGLNVGDILVNNALAELHKERPDGGIKAVHVERRGGGLIEICRRKGV